MSDQCTGSPGVMITFDVGRADAAKPAGLPTLSAGRVSSSPDRRLGRSAGCGVADHAGPPRSVRVFVIFLEPLFVRMRVLVTGAVVAVLVLMLHVFVLVEVMRVHVGHVAVLVLMAVWRLGHLRSILPH